MHDSQLGKRCFVLADEAKSKLKSKKIEQNHTVPNKLLSKARILFAYKLRNAV
jgi:hypothetical protein